VRLTQAKLAGFKSFVDPTSIPVPGQLVAVVGPNGCGKSNVIDAVRWVLGESSARQLRGESMQDVIFNGSDQRKPVSRAAVELLFDNSLGRAAGQWSQYAEISIKRVLTRQGESSYYINNIQCRRRDIADLFLGTGVGTRGYAVIEQGMISRIIEARPEELRVFLEEAAGVSKYKERRKETESRIRDTRDNLLRVDDIRRELEGQLEKLAAQAEVASSYQQLQGQLAHTQNLLALLRQQDAEREQQKLERDIAANVNQLESALAGLRELEMQIEAQRGQHFAATDQLQRQQGELYEANAEVARLEQQQLHLQDSRNRINHALTQHRQQSQQLQQQLDHNSSQQQHWQMQQQQASERSQQGQQALEQAAQVLPQLEQAHRELQQASHGLQQQLADSLQARERVRANRQHALRLQQQLEQRCQRLQQEQASLGQVDAAALEELQWQLEDLQQQKLELEQQQSEQQVALPQLEQTRRDASQQAQSLQQQVLRLEAQQAALQQLQQRTGHGQHLRAWLAQHGLHQHMPLWQQLQVQAGWETAVEAVLRDMLQALPEPADLAPLLADAVPARLGLYSQQACEGSADLFGERDEVQGARRAESETYHEDRRAFEHRATQQFARVANKPASSEPIAERAAAGLQPLLDKLSSESTAIMAAVASLLQQVYVCDDITALPALRQQLPPGARLVSRDGHLASRNTLQLFAPDSEQHGTLARQRELEQLAQDIALLQTQLDSARETLQQAEQALAQHQAHVTETRQQLDQLNREQHQQQLQWLKQQQALEQWQRRGQQISDELAELTQQLQQELEVRGEAEYAEAELDQQIDALQQQRQQAQQAQHSSETALEQARQAQRNLDRDAREAEFQLRTAQARLHELQQLAISHAERQQQLQQQQEELLLELENLAAGGQDDALQAALLRRSEREQQLNQARDALGHLTNLLRESEAGKLRLEQGLDPLRDGIGQLRLKAQEARLASERYAQELSDNAADLPALLPLLGNARAGSLQAQIGSLTQQIEALGAVNLAAMQELNESSQRKLYLDSQADDLNQAMDMLESAIRKIDKESSELLQSTFDQVNASMSELFPLLFGGGQARLVMTGETILDAGIQVIAQPPGKKNSSIHLLSGGEKALTALSLVFALFQLNPAPFCLLDEVDAPLDDANTGRFCEMVKRMSAHTQFLYISHNKITMEMADQLIGITMQEKGVSRVVAVDIEQALTMRETVQI
jgi:chromosome segregation protein